MSLLRKLTLHTNEEFLADSSRCCYDAMVNGNEANARYWADHVFSFARLLYGDWMWFHKSRVIQGGDWLAVIHPN